MKINVSKNDIEVKAYYNWLKDGGIFPGNSLDYWLYSEQEVIFNNIVNFIVAILIFPSKKSTQKDLLGVGTGFFIEKNNETYLITALHVYQYYLCKRLKNKDTVISISGGSFAKTINDWELVIASGKYDIAVLKVPSTFDIKSINKEFFIIDYDLGITNNIDTDWVFFVGFPSKHVIKLKEHLELNFCSINCPCYFLKEGKIKRFGCRPITSYSIIY